MFLVWERPTRSSHLPQAPAPRVSPGSVSPARWCRHTAKTGELSCRPGIGTFRGRHLHSPLLCSGACQPLWAEQSHVGHAAVHGDPADAWGGSDATCTLKMQAAVLRVPPQPHPWCPCAARGVQLPRSAGAATSDQSCSLDQSLRPPLRGSHWGERVPALLSVVRAPGNSA